MLISFDTSNYTTSMAILDGDTIVLDKRIPIHVKSGMRGIRQSDAFFQHVNHLDFMVKQYLSDYADKLQAVAVSSKPRPIIDSYMPVFRAGMAIGQTIAASKKIPLYETSHQEGHLFSAMYGNCMPDEFLFFHLSGGTTELNRVKLTSNFFKITPLMSSADINFGQLIDRIGVKSGLDFPCGAEMDQLAQTINPLPKVPLFKVNNTFNLSGYENYFTNLLNKLPNEQVYYTVFITIGDIIKRLVMHACKEFCIPHILIAGGVAENSIIQKHLSETLTKKNIKISFAQKGLAKDNAVGVGRIGQLKLREVL